MVASYLSWYNLWTPVPWRKKRFFRHAPVRSGSSDSDESGIPWRWCRHSCGQATPHDWGLRISIRIVRMRIPHPDAGTPSCRPTKLKEFILYRWPSSSGDITQTFLVKTRAVSPDTQLTSAQQTVHTLKHVF